MRPGNFRPHVLRRLRWVFGLDLVLGYGGASRQVGGAEVAKIRP